MRTLSHIIVALALMACAIAAPAATIRDFFVSEPGTLLANLPKTARLNMLAYYDNGQLVQGESLWGNGSKLVTVDSSYLALNTSKARLIEMRLIVKGNDTVVVVIETASLPALDSRISFYNARWQPLETSKFFQMPTLAAFIKKDAPLAQVEKLQAALSFPVIQLRFTGARHDCLTASHSLRQFLSKEDYNAYSPLLTDSLEYQLKGKRFKLINKKK